MARITEIAPDIFQITQYLAPYNLQFHQFLVRDDEPLLFHTGLRQIFPEVLEAVGSLIDPAELRWIAFSHFEADECGALGDWFAHAPKAEAVCSLVGKLVNMDDIHPDRPARGMIDGEVLCTGRYRLRLLHTPHVPHGWDASMMFEETHGTLLCSDLLTQPGDAAPQTGSDVVGAFRDALVADQQGPLAHAYPLGPHLEPTLKRLAGLAPKTLAIMHGSTFVGDGARAFDDLAMAMRDLRGDAARPN